VSPSTATGLAQRGGARVVRAAGGMVCRPGPGGLAEIALVHRPAYDDWTLPKGKLDGEETLEQACLREVEEETGLRCKVLGPIACTEYLDQRGRVKVVFYWKLRPLGGTFRPTAEVDDLRWLTVEESLTVLTHERDRKLVREARLD
jgi:8-oxo-dGTP pyrophosphatase MutT (NUDIX family)